MRFGKHIGTSYNNCAYVTYYILSSYNLCVKRHHHCPMRPIWTPLQLPPRGSNLDMCKILFRPTYYEWKYQQIFMYNFLWYMIHLCNISYIKMLHYLHSIGSSPHTYLNSSCDLRIVPFISKRLSVCICVATLPMKLGHGWVVTVTSLVVITYLPPNLS